MPSREDAPEQAREQFLVVTGSSAGGIDALIAFVSHLPDSFSIPVVIAQHLSPAHESRLGQILSQKTSLTVQTVGAATIIQPGHLYVVPPDHDVELVDSIATTAIAAVRGPKPSIDRLFASAAERYGDRLIAVILSGLGSDGARGVPEIKKAGGTVIVQDPQSAAFSAMPLAIPPTMVDIVAPPEAMGRIIVDMVGAAELPPGGTDRNMLRMLLGQLRERSGIDFSQYKTPTIMRRLSRLMVANGLSSISEYITSLQRDPEGYQRLVNAFLIKVTGFFRDAELFGDLRDRILPKLMAEACDQGRELRIWSAGTSTGEEAYSLAILCAELLRDQSVAADVRIFATDIDERAITFARRGVYIADSLRHIPEALVSRYFINNGNGDRYEVSKQIRNMTVFGQHDLAQRAPFPRIDLVLCRNVLIYFTKELQARVLQLFAFALRDRGYLVLGKAESTTPLPQFFKPINTALKIYEREGQRVILPPAQLKSTTRLELAPAILATTRETRPLHNQSEPSAARAHDLLAAYVNASVVGVVVVDRKYDIVAINSPARGMLQIHGVGVGSDLVHLLPSTGIKLRQMIDAAFSGEVVKPEVVVSKDAVSGIDRWLQVHCSSQRRSGSAPDTAGLVIVDVTRYERRIADADAEAARIRSEKEEQAARAEELSARVKSMLTANEELTAMNSELRTYNEQLVINAEEAASSNEEIETLNEEMQATNEELETLNEELQATVEELNTTNDELEARSRDLEGMNLSKQKQVEEAKSQRLALSLALENIGCLCAVVSDRGEMYYIAPAVSELTKSDGNSTWWREATNLSLSDGSRFATNVTPLDGGIHLVTFEPMK